MTKLHHLFACLFALLVLSECKFGQEPENFYVNEFFNEAGFKEEFPTYWYVVQKIQETREPPKYASLRIPLIDGYSILWTSDDLTHRIADHPAVCEAISRTETVLRRDEIDKQFEVTIEEFFDDGRCAYKLKESDYSDVRAECVKDGYTRSGYQTIDGTSDVFKVWRKRENCDLATVNFYMTFDPDAFPYFFLTAVLGGGPLKEGYRLVASYDLALNVGASRRE